MVVASIRTVPPAAPLSVVASPLARIFPSSCNVPVVMRTTPPPERHGRQFVPPPAALAPPGSFGLKTDPYAAGTFPLNRPPWPPWLPPLKFVAPPVRLGAPASPSEV